MDKYDRKTINKVKKFLGITKQELILLKVYQELGMEFDIFDEAVEYVLQYMEIGVNEPIIEEIEINWDEVNEDDYKDNKDNKQNRKYFFHNKRFKMKKYFSCNHCDFSGYIYKLMQKCPKCYKKINRKWKRENEIDCKDCKETKQMISGTYPNCKICPKVI